MTVTQNFLISTSWKRKILNLDTKANTIHNSFCWINIGTVTSRSLQRRLLALSRKLKKTILFLLVSRLKHWHDTRSHASQCTNFPPPYLSAHPSRLLTTIVFQAFLTSLYSTFCAKELEYPLPCSHKPTTGPYPKPLESIFRVVLWTVHCCCSFKPNIIGQQNRESYSVGPVGRANLNLLSCYLRLIFILPQVDAYTTGIFYFIKFSNKNLFLACYMSLPSVLHAFNP